MTTKQKNDAARHKAALDIAIEAPLLALARARRDGCDLADPALRLWRRTLADAVSFKLLIDESERR